MSNIPPFNPVCPGYCFGCGWLCGSAVTPPPENCMPKWADVFSYKKQVKNGGQKVDSFSEFEWAPGPAAGGMVNKDSWELEEK